MTSLVLTHHMTHLFRACSAEDMRHRQTPAKKMKKSEDRDYYSKNITRTSFRIDKQTTQTTRGPPTQTTTSTVATTATSISLSNDAPLSSATMRFRREGLPHH